MTDSSLIFVFIGIQIFVLLLTFPLILFMKLGGWPEGFYRIFRVKYFSPIFIDSENTPRRFPLKSSIIKTGDPNLPPYFEYKGFSNGVGRYYLDKVNQTKHNGRMSQYYYPDNPFPIPLLTLAHNPMISAESLEKMYNDETVLDFLKVGKEKKTAKGRGWLLYAIIGLVMLAVVILTLRFI